MTEYLHLRVRNPVLVVRNEIDKIKARVRAKLDDFKLRARTKINYKIDLAATKFVAWLISKRAVQHVIADQFASGTPMCRVLTDAVESAVNGLDIDADDVRGLDRYIESAMEQLEISVTSVSGLDRAFEDFMENYTLDADNVEGLEDVIKKLNHEIDVDNISGLDDKIDESVKEQLKDFTIDADNVEGLDTAVRECIGNDLKSGDLTTELASEVTPEVCKAIIEKLS